MPRFVATIRAAFDASTDGEAEAVGQNVLMACEEVLGEEDEGEEPSYQLQMTELLPFDSASTHVELADDCLKLRNKLVATKSKDAIYLATELDKLAWQLRNAVDPTLTDIHPQYDSSRIWEICEAVWRGENPTD